MKRPAGLVVAIDGTAGTGKSSVGRAAAQRLGYGFLSTGLLYRALACQVLEQGIDPTDEKAVLAIAKSLQFTFERQPDATLKMFVNGQDLGARLGLDEVGQTASKSSVHAGPREVLSEKMREAGRNGGIIMEGRDIGTVVFPDAEVKIYLDASAEERARRRVAQLQEQGVPADYAAILASIKQRDERDSTRAVSPLKPAPDALIIDTSAMSMQEVTDTIVKEISNHGA